MANHEVRMPGYKLTARVGEGGMGVVFKGVQLSLNREVAVKVLSPELANDETFVKRFLREAKAAGQLNHKNIARTYDAGEVGGLNYIVMELIEGGSIADMLEASGRLSIEKASELVAQVADGLAYAHSLGIVHRDIKPSNVMLASEGTPKIMDMGLAKRLSGKSEDGLTLSGEMFGSPQYMSPEQIRSTKDVGRSTDIFSLGATLYRMVVGKTPFEGASVGEIMVKTATEAVQFPREAADELPAPLKRLIKHMLSKHPGRRPSAEEVAHELRQMLATGFKDERAAARARMPVPARRGRPYLAPVGIVVIAVAAIVVLVFALRNGTETDRDRAAFNEKESVRETARETTAGAPVPVPTPEPEPAPLPAREPGYYAFQDALEFSKEHPKEYAKRLQEFRRVADEYPAFKEESQAEMEKINAEVKQLAQEVLKKAKAVEDEGRLYAAVSILRDFGERFKEFEVGKNAAESVRRLEEKIKQRFAADLEKVKTLTAEGKHEGVLAVLAQVKNYGDPAMCQQAAQLEKGIRAEALSGAAKEAVENQAREVFEEGKRAFDANKYEQARALLRKLRCDPLRGTKVAGERSDDVCKMMWQIAQKIGRKKVNTEKEIVAALFDAAKAVVRKKKDRYDVTLTYDFERQQQSNDWTWHKGQDNTPKWSIAEEDGRRALQAKGVGSRVVWCGSFAGDVSVKARLKFKGDSHVAIQLHNNQKESYVFAMNMDQRFFDWFGLPPELSELGSKGVRNLIFQLAVNRVVALDKTSASGSGAKLAPKADKWLLVEARIKGKSLRLTMDGRTLVSGFDESNLSGSVKLEVGGARVLWDEVTLSGLLDPGWVRNSRIAMIHACVREGVKAYHGGDYDAAYRKFDKLVEIMPDSAEAWCWRGIALFALKLWEEAIFSLETALKQDKRLYEADYWKGRAHFEHGEYEKAIDAFKESLSVCADNKEGWRKLAECYKRLNKTQEAEEALKKAGTSEQTSLLPEFSDLPTPPIEGVAKKDAKEEVKKEDKPAGKHKSEREVTIDQVPKKVRKAILKEVGNGELVDIAEITEGAKKFYEIEMVKDGNEYDVLFDSDGKVLKKTFEGHKGGHKGR